jgi:hypothetical protein
MTETAGQLGDTSAPWTHDVPLTGGLAEDGGSTTP